MGPNMRQGEGDSLTLYNTRLLIVAAISSRMKRPFAPPTVSLKEIHDAVPKHLLKSMIYFSDI